MDTDFIVNHIKCTREEKLACMETVEKILILSQTSRCYGLVELEKLIENEKYQNLPMMKIGVSLIANGTEPVIVKEILESYIISSELSNKEFLDNMLICKGILAIQQGDNPQWIWEKLCSLFGLEFRKDFSSYFGQTKIDKKLSQLLEDYKEELETFPKTKILDFVLQEMDDRGMQRVLLDLSLLTLEYAVIGTDLKIAAFFLKNMGERRQQQFFEDIKYLENVDIQSIEQKQKEIVNVIERLAEQGEIIINLSEQGKFLQEEINDLFI